MLAEFVEHNPTPQTVCFHGTHLNLSALARESGVHHSLVSRVFSGKRKLTLSTARRLSLALGMGLEEFISAIDSMQD